MSGGGGGGGFTLVDFTVPSRDNTMTHEPTEAPLCDECQTKDLCFFDPTCSGCQDLLLDSTTTISQLFAVMRQWVPQTQRNMSSLSREVLRRGANVNDRDGLTDLSLLHFACKSGAAGVGNIDAAVNLVNSLLNKGADCELRCKWTNMNALHYAVFFDVPEIVDTLLDHKPSLLDTTCEEFEGGTALHIAASNLSLRAAQILLQHDANCQLTDKNSRLPLDVVPSNQTEGPQGEMTNRMRLLLLTAAEEMKKKKEKKEEEEREREREREKEEDKENAMEVEPSHLRVEEEKINKSHPPAPGKPPRSPAPSRTPSITTAATTSSSSSTTSANLALKKTHSPRNRDSLRSRGARSPVSTVSSVSSRTSSRAVSPAVDEVTMETLGIKIGDRILIDAKSTSGKSKPGTIRYGGTVDFLGGQWAGVELDEGIGKNDGSLKGIRFFTCKPKFGLFVPMNRISKAPKSVTSERRKKSANGGRKRESVALSPRTFEAQGAMAVTTDLQVGERVSIDGNGTGILRFIGTVKFAPGIWMGVELESGGGGGDNSGSHSGVRYFNCRPNHGIFLPPSKVKRVSPVSMATSLGSSMTARSTDAPDMAGHTTSSSSPSPHPSPPVTKRRLNTSKAAPRPKQARTTNPPPSSSSTSSSLSYNQSLSSSSLSLSSLPNVTLETGMNVFVTGADFGVVKYIGTTEFAKGVWLGIELRRPNGKNDGSVKGHRYFKCKPSYGLFVKPEKATHRGINCGKILPESVLEKST